MTGKKEIPDRSAFETRIEVLREVISRMTIDVLKHQGAIGGVLLEARASYPQGHVKWAKKIMDCDAAGVAAFEEFATSWEDFEPALAAPVTIE